MLTHALARLGKRARPAMTKAPWGSGLGLARTLLALGTLGTLLSTTPTTLMAPLADGTLPPTCSPITKFGLWCVLPGGHGEVARWLSIAVLLVVAAGWRPRFTGVAHWYVAWSLMVNVSILDGGDQVTTVLTLLLVPITLTDPRRWHWQAMPERSPGWGRVVAYTALILVQIQVAVIYLHASVAKLGVREWADGTAMFYWLRHPTFGTAGWMRPIADIITASPLGVAAMTWASIALEFALAIALLLRAPLRRWLLIGGLIFHGLIAVSMGLLSFSTAMAGALLLYLLPIGHQLVWPQRALAALSALRREPVREPVHSPPAGSPEPVARPA
jgi:antimicrobial peptide system SdpB family protein